ncbi:MAG: class I SAM-dependent RNA methyltransferase [Treponema sp.]|jgi:putative N6-adenine-specific DNA methylase|nr:class I SAM-dependent RNA methyltransferase [Treponema sp.]
MEKDTMKTETAFNTTLTAFCAVGAEKPLSNELRKLGFPVIEGRFGNVRFRSDLAGIYRALMSLRTADRILLETAVFPADTFDTLFEGVRSIPWEDVIPKGAGIRVGKVRTNRSLLTAETAIQAVVHKAAAGRLCEKYKMSRLPETGFVADIRVYIEKNQASVLLDLSGDPLFKRGYRTEGGVAPLRETTAAALLLLANWRRKFPLYDPFCGAGTIAIEAALYAWNMAPCMMRTFAVSGLAFHDDRVEHAVREELRAQIDVNRVIRIYGSDADSRSISIAASNISRAYGIALGKKPPSGIQAALKLPFLPQLTMLPMKDAVAPVDDAGYIITNPPYGVRLGDKTEAEAVYAAMAGLRQRFPRWNLGVITDEPAFESFFGQKADSCTEITNGAKNSYFFQYGMV